MRVKMKRCTSCNTLLSNSSKVCTKCGSKKIEKGVYTDESNRELKISYNNHNNHINIYCPTCSAPITIINGYGECCFCGDEISVINNDDSNIIVSGFQESI